MTRDELREKYRRFFAEHESELQTKTIGAVHLEEDSYQAKAQQTQELLVGNDGITYYRCGGGRRVIRKRIGGH